MALDLSNPIDRIRLLLGDWQDVQILPDEVYEYALSKYDNNEKSAAVEVAYNILAVLSQNTHSRIDRIELYGNQAFDQHLTLIKEFLRSPLSSFNVAGVYAGGIDVADVAANVADTTTIVKEIPSYTNYRDTNYENLL